MNDGGSPARLTGRIVVPGDRGYDAARAQFNLRFDVRPRVIVFCQTPDDVANAVRWAREHDVPIHVRGGRHAYEPLSIGAGIVIDVIDLDSVAVDAENQLAVVGAGVALLPLTEALAARGFALPMGSCPTVGITGLTLGGGYGYLSRARGLTCDSLIAVEMIDASGARLRATETEHPDLLWACRGGGGGSFGIVISLTFRLRRIGPVTSYRMVWKRREGAAVFDAWQRWAPFTDDRLTSLFKLRAGRRAPVESVGLFLAPAVELVSLLTPLVSAGTARVVELVETPYLDAARRFAGVVPGQRRWRAHWNAIGSTRFKNSSDYARKPLDREAIEIIRAHLATAPSRQALVSFDAYGGAVNRIPADATAFPHRDGTLYGLQYQIYWKHPTEEEACVRWLDDLRAAMRPFVSGGAYVNYPDLAIPDWQCAYFGANLRRLVAVKTRHDPDNVFRHAQSIPPALLV
jgi:FAD/FMN-containing dehydrogenase